MMVVTIVVRRSSGVNNAARLGRRNVPAALFRCQAGDSGRNGRITMSGRAHAPGAIRNYHRQLKHAFWNDVDVVLTPTLEANFRCEV